MLYIYTDSNNVPSVITSEDAKQLGYNGVQSRWDWKSLEEVTDIAARLTAATGTLYLGTDAGGSISPRYDVVEAPKVGDEVSMEFNGDGYPCGNIVSISKSLKLIVTSDGKKFYRRKLTSKWLNGGTFVLVQGHVDKRNPHF